MSNTRISKKQPPHKGFPIIESAFKIKILKIWKLPGGYNEVYKLSTNKGLRVLKISEKLKKAEHTLFEHNFLRTLKEHGFTIVAEPLSIIDNRDLDGIVGETIAIKDGRIHSFFKYLEGELFNESAEHLSAAGQNLAKYHQVSSSILAERFAKKQTDYLSIRSEWGDLVMRYPPLSQEKIERLDLKENDPWSTHVKAIYKPKIYRTPSAFYSKALQTQESFVDNFVIECTEFVNRKIEEIRSSLFKMGFRCNETKEGLLYYFPLPKTIVHADYAPQNVKFKSNAVNAMFDFDNANARERIYDIAWALATFCVNKNQSLNFSKIELFLNGYQDISKLSIGEVNVIPHEIYTRCIETMYWAVQKYYSGKPYRLDYALKDYELIKWLYMNEEKLINFVIKKMIKGES